MGSGCCKLWCSTISRKNRPLSVKEYTRIQHSLDDWVFAGATFGKYRQIGNAIPVGLAEGINIMIRNKETNTISAIAIKSGSSVFNADSKRRQEQNFTATSKLV